VLLVPTPIFKSYEALFTYTRIPAYSHTNSLSNPCCSSLSKSLYRSMCEVGAKLHGVCDVKAGTGLFAGHCFDMTEAQIAAFPELGLGITVHKDSSRCV